MIAKYKPFKNFQSTLLSTILVSKLSGGKQQQNLASHWLPSVDMLLSHPVFFTVYLENRYGKIRQHTQNNL